MIHDIRNYITPETPYVNISLVIDVEDIFDEVTNQVKYTGKLSLYFNGVKVDEILTTHDHIKGLAFSTVEPLCVGGDWRIGTKESEVNSRYFRGMLKNITVYSDIRTDEEILAFGTSATYSVKASDKNLMAAYDLTKTPFSANLKGDDNYLLMYTRNGSTFTSGKDPLQMAKVLPADSLPLTFEATIFLPDYVTEDGGVIIGNVASIDTAGVISLEIGDNGNPQLTYTGANGEKNTYVFDTVSVLKNKWVHLVVVHDGNALNCYIDGKLAQSITADVTAYSEGGLTLPLCVGGDWQKGNINAFKGTIRELAIYSTAKTATEISTMYTAGVDTAADGIIAYYDMRETNGKSYVADTSVNAKWNLEKLWLSQRTVDTSKYAYTFAVIGDTQKLVYQDYLNSIDTIPENDSAHMASIYDWIVANKDSENIQYVMGLGDIIEYNYNIGEWDIAYENITKLEAAGIPYSLVCGNHDKVYRLDEYFANEKNFTASNIVYYEMNKELGVGSLGNYYQKIEVSGVKYMIMCLDFGANDLVLRWASNEIEKNPDYRVIITTHSYLYRDGTTLDGDDEVPPNPEGETGDTALNNGDDMWNELFSQHRNILLILSGHDGVENIIWRQDRGEEGNMVSQFLIDPQTFDVQQNYQTGMVALFHFSEDGRKVAVEWYSTVKGMYYKTENQFEFKLIDNFGNGIYKTEYIGSNGLVDTYRIYYTNGTYEDFTVTNGAQGEQGEQGLQGDKGDKGDTGAPGKDGIDGKDGQDGKTPYIGENGNWWIGIVDTGVNAGGGSTAEPDYGNKVYEGTCGSGLKWYVTDKNILVISGNGAMKNYRAGETPWADYANDITEIVIENGVTSIGRCAFYGFTKLENVKLPLSLLTIEWYSFYKCVNLESITIPANVRFIGVYAFKYSGLKSFVLRNPEAWSIEGLTETPDNMNLNGVAAAYIKNTYYDRNWYVADVAVGEVITNGVCGTDVYWSLTSDGTLTIFGNGNMANYRSNTLPWGDYIDSIFTVIIEDGVTSVGNYSFVSAIHVKNVTIPESITSIGSYAFYRTGIETVYIPASVKTIGEMAFAYCDSLRTVYFGNADGWTVNGTAILSSQLLDPTVAAECIALNVSYEWKLEEKNNSEE